MMMLTEKNTIPPSALSTVQPFPFLGLHSSGQILRQTPSLDSAGFFALCILNYQELIYYILTAA